MTITASQANKFTQDTIARNSDKDVTTELQLAEQQIRASIRAERFTLSYDANIIGNPQGDSLEDDQLSDNQIAFRDHFTDDGYKVGIDEPTGNWLIDWNTIGTEEFTNVYSVRTTVSPGTVKDDTIEVIDEYFANLSLRATSRTVLADTSPTSGGDIPEGDFGAPDSTFYEYIAIVGQQNNDDNSAGLQTALESSGLGYGQDTRITGATGSSSNTTSATNTLDISDGTTTETVTVGGTGTAQDLVDSINSNTTLQSIDISAAINGSKIVIVNELGGLLTATNNVGDVLGDIFELTSPQNGVVTDNTQTYKFA